MSDTVTETVKVGITDGVRQLLDVLNESGVEEGPQLGVDLLFIATTLLYNEGLDREGLVDLTNSQYSQVLIVEDLMG